jgi:CRISPR-associated protein Csm4
MKYKYCKLKPTTPLHLGERETWREGSSVFIHSDTLFSGICHCYGMLYGQDELKNFLKKEKEERSLIFSSAFPFWDNNLYFPIPKTQIPEDKEAYKIKFIEQAGFEQLLTGKSLEELTAQGFKVIPRKEIPHTPWEMVNVPRITLNRFSNHPVENGGYFHSGRVYYQDSAGFFFLYQTRDEQTEQKFQAAMRLLADEGIGGDRSCGNGLMEIPEFSEVEVNVPTNVNGELTLSLYFPDEAEIGTLADGHFELLERKGYIYSPFGQSLRRCSLRMFTEGSVFPIVENRVGSMEDVCPEIFKDHPVYRMGMFFGIPCVKEVIVA